MSAITSDPRAVISKVDAAHQIKQGRKLSAWSDSAANDVTLGTAPATELTYYRMKPQPFALNDDAKGLVEQRIDFSLQKAVCAELQSKLCVIGKLHESDLITNKQIKKIIKTVARGDNKSAFTDVTRLLQSGLDTLKQLVMNNAQKLVMELPNGEAIWNEVKRYSLYGFSFDVADGQYQLRYDASDFFCHFEIGLTKAPPVIRNGYIALINKLLCIGDGVWQTDISGFGCWDMRVPDTESELSQIKAFVKELEVVDFDQASALLVGHKSELIDAFIEDVEQGGWYNLRDIIEEDDEENFESAVSSLVEGAEFLECMFAAKEQGIGCATKSWSEIVEALQGDTELNTLLVKAGQIGMSTLGDENLQHPYFTMVDETHPGFGIVLCPFAEDSEVGKALHGFSGNIYDDIMNCGEAEDAWTISMDKGWINGVLQRTAASVLLIAIIEGIGLIEKG